MGERRTDIAINHELDYFEAQVKFINVLIPSVQAVVRAVSELVV